MPLLFPSASSHFSPLRGVGYSLSWTEPTDQTLFRTTRASSAGARLYAGIDESRRTKKRVASGSAR